MRRLRPRDGTRVDVAVLPRLPSRTAHARLRQKATWLPGGSRGGNLGPRREDWDNDENPSEGASVEPSKDEGGPSAEGTSSACLEGEGTSSACREGEGTSSACRENEGTSS